MEDEFWNLSWMTWNNLVDWVDWTYYPVYSSPKSSTNWNINTTTKIYITCRFCGKMIEVVSFFNTPVYCPHCSKKLREETKEEKLDTIIRLLEEIKAKLK